MTYTLASSVETENDYLKKALLELYLFSYYVI